MEEEIILIYCICDDYLKINNHYKCNKKRMSDAEVLAFVIVAARFFHAHHERTRLFMGDHGYIDNILSKSQLNRRLHKLDETLLQGLLDTLNKALSYYKNSNSEYIVDSFPVTVCQNSRINRCKIFRTKEYHGYTSSKQSYFYGIKVHMITTSFGFPYEVSFTPGSCHDMQAFKQMRIDLPPGSFIYGDKAYTNYQFEDELKSIDKIMLIPARQKNHSRQLSQERKFINSKIRKRIETTFSQITGLFPKTIHAVTKNGFCLKIFHFILAYSVYFFLKEKQTLA